MNRRGFTFFRRIVHSFFNGMFLAKTRRHLFKLGPVRRFLSRRLSRFPVEPGKVVFAAFSGNCDCNPKYLQQALSRQCPGLDVVWLLGAGAYRRHKAAGGIPGCRIVQMWTLAALREVATAKVWVDNAQTFLQDGMPPKRPGQTWVNTWHGSLGIKRLDTADPVVRARAERMAGAVDVVLTNSEFEDGVFSSSIFPRTPLRRIGHARNDVFFLPPEAREDVRVRVRAVLGLRDGEKFAVYAPTFREAAFFTSASTLNLSAWAEAFAKRFGGKWRVALRLHPHDAKALAEGLFRLPPGVLDVSGYEDVQELLVAADACVTDYSSLIFDYLLGGGPGFVYAPDKRKYDESRGFCYPLEETPFPVAQTEGELAAAIRSFDFGKYAADRAAFLAARGCMEDGHAAERAAGLVADIVRGDWS